MSPDTGPVASPYVEEPDLPLSTMQAGILTEHALDPDAARYNVPLAFEITGPLDSDAVSRALDRLVSRHEILRTVYHHGAEGVIQAIAPSIPPILRRENGIEAGAFEDLCRRESGRSFDLSSEPPVRAVLFEANAERHALCLVFHHVAVDGWSIRLILDELSRLYEAERNAADPGLADLDLQYADWAGHQHDRLAQGALDVERDRVVGRFDGLDLDLGWPFRGIRSDAVMVPFTLEPGGVLGVEALARRAGTTSYAVLAGAFAMLVSRLSGERTLLFGTSVALRDRPEVQEIVGCFVNTVPVRIDIDPLATVGRYLRSTSRAVVDALDTREVPFDQIIRRLAGKARAGAAVRAFFNFDDAPLPLPRFQDCAVNILDSDRGTAKFDLMLSMVRVEGEIRAAFDVAADVFAQPEIERFEDLYRRVLGRMVDAPEESLGALGLLRANEAAGILEMGRGEAREVDRATLHERVLAEADRVPREPAVRAPDGDLDFSGLRDNALTLARLLSANGVGRGDRVVVMRRRGVGLPVAMVAAMAAGAGYVPLEPSLPDARLADILRDAAPTGIICDEADVDRILSLAPSEVAVIAGQALLMRVARIAGPPGSAGEIRPNDLAYVIYTSGSTGRPKGVMVPHRGVINYLDWAVRTYDAGIGEGTGIVTSSAFDATVLSFWAPLLAGKPLDLLPEDAAVETLSARLSSAVGYGFVKMTPAHLDLLADLTPVHAQARGAGAFVVGGEALAGASVAPWRHGAPGVRIFNEYGPTETVVGCCVHEVGDDDTGETAVPIGHPIANTSLYVLDNDLNLMPPGTAGELFIGGAGVAWGYWRRPGLTAERFLADPFEALPGARMYRTGDLVRMRANGVFDYLGRVDDQIKLRGYRIEPGEIEAALRAIDGVRAAAVVVVGDGSERRLIGYVVGGPTEADLKTELAASLPTYMVPDRLLALEALPLTGNGKTDRRRLAMLDVPDVDAKADTGSVDAGPMTIKLTGLWASTLKVDATPTTDFFAAGGTSLSAIRLLARLKRDLTATIGFADLVEAPTPGSMAVRVEQLASDAPKHVENVLKIVRDVLGRPDLSADLDLVASGVTSLNIVRVTARLRRQFGAGVGADAVFSGRTVRGVATLLATMQPDEDLGRDPTITSPAERQLWLDGKVNQGGGSYVMQAAMAIKGRIETARLNEAARALGERHPVLCGLYEDDGQELRFKRLDQPAATISAFAVEGDPEALARSIARDDATRPFALEKGETWRLSLIAGDVETAIILSVHHIVSDATSLAILLRDLIAVFSGSTLPGASSAEYRSYTRDRDRVISAMAERQTAYWRDRLTDLPGGLELPVDRPRRLGHKPRGGSLSFSVPSDVVAELDAAARAEGARPHAVFVAAYAVLLHRLTESRDLIFGVPVNDRPEGFEEVVGLFLNTLPLRVRPTSNMTARALVRQIADSMTGLLGNADLPLSSIVKAVNPPREPGRTPLLHTVLDWREETGEAVDLTSVKPVDLEVATAPFDLAVTLRKESDGSVRGGMIFDAALLDRETVEVWARALVRIIKSIVADSAIEIAALLAIDEEDLPKSVIEAPVSEQDRSLLDGLTSAFKAHRDHIAIETPSETLTYAALWVRSESYQHPHQHSDGVVMAIDTADPLERVVAALAALCRGQAIALIDPALPPARVERMRRTLADGEAAAAAPVDDATAPAYVQFTSGSTGLPKAAVLSRRGLANLSRTIARSLDIGPGSRVAQVAAPAFDAWIWEVFCTLRAGGTLVLADWEDLRPGPPLAKTLAARSVSHVTLTPSVIAALGDVKLPSIRVLIAAGEPLSAELVARWAPGRRMVNAYGPCEATVCATLDDCQVGAGAPTIGRPIPGVAAMVMDRRGNPVIPGANGELWIGGVGVGLGYLGAPELSAERFVKDPRQGVAGVAYRSGDVVRVQSDGRLRFVGRDDRQVKVRGVRIELDEIEVALAAIDGVDQAAVRVVTGGDGLSVVAAWVSGPAACDVVRLRGALSAALPETMMPSYLMAVDAMPMTATGKIDRGALRDPDVAIASAPGSEEPVGPIETEIAVAIAEVLGLAAPVARDTAFFTVGGHSLLAIRLAARLAERLGRTIPLSLLFAQSSPAGLAAALAAQDDDVPCALRVLREGTGETAYIFHAVDGTCHTYLPLVEAWPDNSRIVAVEQIHLSKDLTTLAKNYAEAIQQDATSVAASVVASAGARGGVRLVGWSLGATIAAAVAGHLRAAGEPVAVVLIDAALPSPEDAAVAGDEEALAEVARDVGADTALVDRVRANIRLTSSFVFSHISGAVGLIKASKTARGDVASDLGWGKVFSRVISREFPADHMTILGNDPPALAAAIKILWAETGDRRVDDE